MKGRKNEHKAESEKSFLQTLFDLQTLYDKEIIHFTPKEKLNPFARLTPKKHQEYGERFHATRGVIAGKGEIEQKNADPIPAKQGVLSLPWYLLYYGLPMLGLAIMALGELAMSPINNIPKIYRKNPILALYLCMVLPITFPLAIAGAGLYVAGLIAYRTLKLAQIILTPIDLALQKIVFPVLGYLGAVLLTVPPFILPIVHGILNSLAVKKPTQEPALKVHTNGKKPTLSKPANSKDTTEIQAKLQQAQRDSDITPKTPELETDKATVEEIKDDNTNTDASGLTSSGLTLLAQKKPLDTNRTVIEDSQITNTL